MLLVDAAPVCKRVRGICIVMCLAVAASCAPPTREVIQPAPEPRPVEPVVKVIPLIDETAPRPVTPRTESAPSRVELINAAHRWLSEAGGAYPPERQNLQLKSASALINADQLDAAREVLDATDIRGLPALFSARKRFLRAQLAMRQGRYQDAIRYLQSLSAMQAMGPEFRAQVLGLRAQAQLSTGDRLSAVRDLIEREAYLVDAEQIRRNRAHIWFALGSFDTVALQIARQTENDPVMNGWIDLALIYLDFGADPYRFQQALVEWQQSRDVDSASAFATDNLRSPAYQFTGVGRIALLLPLTSQFGPAAQMVHDGFMAMHDLDGNPQKPSVAVYDVGEVPELASSYYQLAIKEGAEIVVGPLGKSAVSAILGNAAVSVPTLLLGDTEGNGPLPNQAYVLDLAPQLEAEKVANQAYSDGHRVAAVLYPETDWGQRLLEGFVSRWQSLGGTIAETRPYVDRTADYSIPIQQLLNINNSNGRKNMLALKLGQKLEFLPRRRQDLDIVFIAARADAGRLIKPQIDFFQAHDIAVYATSHIFNGHPDPANDADLNDVIFGDMPWLLQMDDRIRRLRENTESRRSGTRGPLDRLFALGIDAYTISRLLPYVGRDRINHIQGVTANLFFGADGRIDRKLVWARFQEGLPVLLETNAYGEHGFDPGELDKASEIEPSIKTAAGPASGRGQTRGASGVTLSE